MEDKFILIRESELAAEKAKNNCIKSKVTNDLYWIYEVLFDMYMEATLSSTEYRNFELSLQR